MEEDEMTPVTSASETTAAPLSDAPDSEAYPPAELWFWDEAWQAGEREADADIAAGRTTTYDNVDEFMDSLDIVSEAEPKMDIDE